MIRQPELHWACAYIGQAWEAGAQGVGANGGPAWDCWAFFRAVQWNHFGIEVPIVVPDDYDDGGGLVRLMRGHAEGSRWAPVAAPMNGDGVVIHRPLHVGTWLDVDGGGVLHCVRGIGVIFTRDAAWGVSGFGRREFRRFAGAA